MPNMNRLVAPQDVAIKQAAKGTLSPNGTVQMTEYGHRVQIIANFSERDLVYDL